MLQRTGGVRPEGMIGPRPGAPGMVGMTPGMPQRMEGPVRYYMLTLYSERVQNETSHISYWCVFFCCKINGGKIVEFSSIKTLFCEDCVLARSRKWNMYIGLIYGDFTCVVYVFSYITCSI